MPAAAESLRARASFEGSDEPLHEVGVRAAYDLVHIVVVEPLLELGFELGAVVGVDVGGNAQGLRRLLPGWLAQAPSSRRPSC